MALNQEEVLKILDLYLPTANVMPEWLEGDSKNVSAFFGTTTGKKLSQIANFHVAQAAMTACSEKEHGDWFRGLAHGIRVAYATIESLKFRTPQTEEGTQGDLSGIPTEFKE